MSNLTVPLGASETPWSFASRLAARNGMNAREFCQDWGTELAAVVNGERVALCAIADFAGIQVEALAAHAFTRIGRQSFEYRRERLDLPSYRFGKIHVCPACLKDDIRNNPGIAPVRAIYQRALWMIDAIRTCPVHNLALVWVADGADIRTSYDFALCIGPKIDGLLTAKPSRQRPSQLENYIICRLEGARQSPFLDSLPLFVVIATCATVGAIELFGSHVQAKDLIDVEWQKAGGRGFEIVATGPAGFEDFLDRLHASADFSYSGRQGPVAIYGRLYEWLYQARNPAYNPLRDIIAQHIRAHLPLPAGFKVFGKPLEHRLLHSIRSLSLEFGLHPKRLRRVLAAAGLIDKRQDSFPDQRVVFAAEEASWLVTKAQGALSLPEVVEHLNAPRAQAALLAKNRFIEPHVEAGLAGARARYAIVDLDAFLKKLLAGSATVSKPNARHATIPLAAKAACCSAAEIIRLVLDRKLKWTGHLLGVQGYLSLLVDVNEIRMHVRGPETGGVSLRQVATMLETNDTVVRALINNGALATFMAINPVNRCPQVLVKREEIARFQKTYISLYRLTRNRRQHIKAVKNELGTAGIKPAFDPIKIQATFYFQKDTSS